MVPIASLHHRMLLSSSAAAIIFASACQDVDQPTAPQTGTPTFAVEASQQADVIPGDYIVVFNETVNDPPGLAKGLAKAHGGHLKHTYKRALKGFSASLSEKAVDALRRNPNVAYVEADQRVQIAEAAQSWGLDRIDDEDLPLDGTYDYGGLTGAGVKVFILDTGIDLDHPQFGGRVSQTVHDAFGGSGEDCDGHGTHVAGTVGSSSHGVAKGVTLYAVRVLGCDGSGTTSGVIGGIDFATENGGGSAVVNMSLTGGGSAALDAAVKGAIEQGIFFALAAGNGNFSGRPVNACGLSPARVSGQTGGSGAMTVGATEIDDDEASFSNYGSCVTILAPGVNIASTWLNGGANVISGTSMATPHVAGVAALALGSGFASDPASVRTAILGGAESNTIDLHRRSRKNDTPNELLNTAFLGGGGPSTSPPVASFTFGCTNLSCDFDGTSSYDPDGGSIVSYSWDFGDTSASGFGPTPSHTYASAGTYSVTLTLTDDDSEMGATSHDVSVDDASPPPSGSMHVADLIGSSQTKGKSGKWSATVNVEIVDEGGLPVAGATVSGTWGPPSNRGVVGTTGSNGQVSLSSGNMTSGSSVTFTVEDVTHGALTYDSDGNGTTTITISN